VQVKYKGYEKLAFFKQCLALFRKQYAIYRTVPFSMILSDP